MTDFKPHCCPTCGRSLAGAVHGIVVDLTSNTVSTPLGGAKVTARQAEIAYLLAQRMPAFLHEERIYAGVWGTFAGVSVMTMRRRLKEWTGTREKAEAVMLADEGKWPPKRKLR